MTVIDDIKNDKLELGKTKKWCDWRKGKFEKKGDRIIKELEIKEKYCNLRLN